MRKNWLIVFLATSLVTTQYDSFAQSGTKRKIEVRNKNNDPLRGMTLDKELTMAQSLYKSGSYFNAIDYYQDLKGADERNPFYTYVLAECYRFTRDYVPSAHYYVEAYHLDKKDYPRSAYYAGMMFKQQGEYEQAKQWFNQFLEDNKKTSSTASMADEFHRLITQKEMKDLKKKIKVEIEGCDMAMASMKSPQPVTIFNCGPNVNSAYTELSPYPLGDTALLFSTVNYNSSYVTSRPYRKNTPIVGSKETENKDNFPKEHFMVAQKQKGYVDSFQWPLPFYDGNFNGGDFQVGNGCYSPGGDRFYFTRCRDEHDSLATFRCAIFYSDFGAMGWQTPQSIPAINEEGSSSTMPFVAKVGKKEVLYFASDRKLQSRGGYDIWYSIIDPRNKTFRRPQNCGKQVNTMNDEVTPYYDTRLNKLYFASSGKKSFGGFDIYSADGGPSRYTNVQNLGYPINTSADEFYYIKDPIGKNDRDGYLVSNRIGSIALKNPTCCNDIWRIQNEPRLVVMGKVINRKNNEVMSQSVVKMVDQKSDMNTYNSEDGQFLFQMSRNHSYIITADKPGYTSTRASVTTMSVKRSDPDDTINVTIYLDTIKRSFSVSNIYYDYDQANLKPESVASLDTLLNFMKDNPSISVEIYSYTDGKGKEQYNLPLSQRRAQAVLDYLEKNGIERTRMVAKGFGDRNKVGLETTADGKDNPDGRQLNRRTEFRIIDDSKTRRVIFNSALPGSMDQQERNLRLPEEAEDAPAAGATKEEE